MQIVDPELKYCPCCHDEYRRDFFTCAACGNDLIDGSSMQIMLSAGSGQVGPRPLPIMDEGPLWLLQQGSLQDMKNLKRRLEKATVAALITTDAGACGNSCCGPQIYLFVRPEDKERAAAVIRKEYAATESLSDRDFSAAGTFFVADGEQTICPACGFQFVPDGPTCPDCGLRLS